MIQIDMPMPKRCGECPFASADFYNGIMSLSCITPTGRSMYAPDLIHRKDRPAWCPLKDQEAVKPILTPWAVNDDGEVTVYKMECGKCGVQFYYEDQKYCSECGTPILWEGRCEMG